MNGHHEETTLLYPTNVLAGIYSSLNVSPKSRFLKRILVFPIFTVSFVSVISSRSYLIPHILIPHINPQCFPDVSVVFRLPSPRASTNLLCWIMPFPKTTLNYSSTRHKWTKPTNSICLSSRKLRDNKTPKQLPSSAKMANCLCENASRSCSTQVHPSSSYRLWLATSSTARKKLTPVGS